MTDIITEIKYYLSIFAYVFVIYPIKRFIYPAFTFFLDQIYMFGMFFVMYVGLYLYNFDIQRFSTDLATKLIKEDIWLFEWFFAPLVTVWMVSITPADLLLLGMGVIILIKGYQIVMLTYKQFQRIAGDVLIVLLWCYFRVCGKEEQSVMLITKEEVKQKLVMYGIIILVIGMSIIIMVMPNLMMNHIIPINTSSPITVYNTTIDSQYLQMVMP